MATPVVRQRTGNQEGVGSIPSALTFAFFHISLHFLILAAPGPPNDWAWLFFLTILPVWLINPPDFIFLIFYFHLLLLLLILLLLLLFINKNLNKYFIYLFTYLKYTLIFISFKTKKTKKYFLIKFIFLFLKLNK